MINIVVLIYSKKGSTLQLAEEVCRGIDSVNEVKARLRRVDELKQTRQQRMLEKYEKVEVITKKDITDCHGLILGSPTRFGNMAGELKYFIDQTLDIWISGELIGKPGAVFTTTGSLHGGQETTLLSMMLPLFHHGMLLAGIPIPNQVYPRQRPEEHHMAHHTYLIMKKNRFCLMKRKT